MISNAFHRCRFRWGEYFAGTLGALFDLDSDPEPYSLTKPAVTNTYPGRTCIIVTRTIAILTSVHTIRFCRFQLC